MIITVIGSDGRQSHLAHLLNKRYDTIYLSGHEEIKTAKNIVKLSDVIILPMPVTRDNIKISTTDYNIEEILSCISPDACVIGGMCENLKFDGKIFDYGKDEVFTLKNALYTAEASVALGIMNTSFSLNNAEILILGNGRIGKYLAKILSSFCVKITVSARKQKDFDYLKARNLMSVNTNEIKSLDKYDVIFNTIPESVLTKSSVDTIKKTALVIDLASKKSGLNTAHLYIDAKSLPVKYSEQSAAKTLYDSVSKYLKSK